MRVTPFTDRRFSGSRGRPTIPTSPNGIQGVQVARRVGEWPDGMLFPRNHQLEMTPHLAYLLRATPNLEFSGAQQWEPSCRACATPSGFWPRVPSSQPSPFSL